MSYYRSPLGARFTRTPLRFDHQHPEYRDFHKLWMKCRHTFMGEEAVKDQMTVYLKALTEQESEDYEGGNTGEELEAFLQEVGFERYNTIRVPERNNKIVDCEYRNLNISDSDRGPRWNSD